MAGRRRREALPLVRQLVRLRLLIAPVLARTGLLHPQESESREVRDLSGLWRFRADMHHVGFREGWHNGVPNTVPMAVPSSFNELTQDPALREHVGVVWYETTTFVPLAWKAKRVVLYVGSANHHATVWLNSNKIGEHEGGHLCA